MNAPTRPRSCQITFTISASRSTIPTCWMASFGLVARRSRAWARATSSVPAGDVAAGYWKDIMANTNTRLRALAGEAARAVVGHKDLATVEDRLTTAVHRALFDLAAFVPPSRE